MDEVKVDCFAYDKTKHRKCTALKKIQCRDCNFYKTREKFKADRLKALQRIMSLSKDLRNYIVERYSVKGGLEIGDKN